MIFISARDRRFELLILALRHHTVLVRHVDVRTGLLIL
jgi:hypothetical protein